MAPLASIRNATSTSIKLMLCRSRVNAASARSFRLARSISIYTRPSSVALKKIRAGTATTARVPARDLASAVPSAVDTTNGPSTENSNRRFFRPVEKLENGVAIVRYAGRCDSVIPTGNWQYI